MALRFGDGWRGALLRGPSGAGKSDLALRALAAGFRLVADDRVLTWRSGDRVFGRSPAALDGLMEVRGLGVGARATLPLSRVSLVVDLSADVERVPEARKLDIEGVALPIVAFDPFGPSAPRRLAAALEALGGAPDPSTRQAAYR